MLHLNRVPVSTSTFACLPAFHDKTTVNTRLLLFVDDISAREVKVAIVCSYGSSVFVNFFGLSVNEEKMYRRFRNKG